MQSYVITHYVKAFFSIDHNDGLIEVGADDAKLLWPGARGIIGSNNQPAVEVLILEDMGSGKFKVRLDDSSAPAAEGPVAVKVPAAGSLWGSYTIAQAAYIIQPANQMLFPYSRAGVVPRIPSALQGT